MLSCPSRSQLCVDAADPAAQAWWWQGVLGGTVDDDDPDEVAVVLGSGLPELLFLRVPESETIKNPRATSSACCG